MLLFKYFSILLVSFLFLGCVKQPTEPLHVKNLTNQILALNQKISKNEAMTLSKEMIFFSSQLKKDYKLVTPPLYHNFLVNIGLKDRGLCWHFAYDMLSHAKKLNLKSFDYYIGGANINDYWEEHNSLVVTCKGCNFNKGIVLDPWRNSGILYYSKLKDDKKYNWTQRGELRN